jgi:hypothetical protein
MPSLVQQTEAAAFPITDAEDPNSFTSFVREHWVRKQETSSKLPPSPAESIMIKSLQATDDPLKKEERRLTRNVERGAPGDPSTFSLGKTPERRELAKKKSQYYDDAFAVRESKTSARERVHRESMVMVEVRTNVIVRPPNIPLCRYFGS